MRIGSWIEGTLCALAITVHAADAQSVGRMVGSDIVYAAGDVVGTWLAPFHASARDWLGAAGVVAGSAAISPFDDDIDRWFLRHQNDNVWSALHELREGGSAFAGKTIVPPVAVLYVVGVATRSTGIRDGVWGCVASYASESVVRTQVMYRLVGRLRPDSLRIAHVGVPSRQGDQYKFYFPGSNAWGKHSLPAGHIANVAACASFLGHRFSSWWVSVPAYAIAAGVGIGREVDRRHWTSDTVLGALFGYAVGKEVARRQLDRKQREGNGGHSGDDDGASLFFAPSLEGSGVLLGWKASF
jgi:membrane-associated phospholipid phosphatase